MRVVQDKLSPNTYRNEYGLSDHLGNTRVVFTDINGDGRIDNATEIVQENHFYGFGMQMEGSWNNKSVVGSPKQNYKFNGSEWTDDFGLNWGDHGARYFLPAIAAWNGIDALAETYHSFSPFHFGMNNPISFSDPSGMGAENDIYFNHQMQWQKTIYTNEGQDHYYVGEFNATRSIFHVDEKNGELASDPRQIVGGKMQAMMPYMVAANAEYEQQNGLLNGKGYYPPSGAIRSMGILDDPIVALVSLGQSLAVTKSASALLATARLEEQYSLRAVESGFYPVMKRGFKKAQEITWLEKGDVWKFGTTKSYNPFTRYSQKYLDNIGEYGVYRVREFIGTGTEAVQLQNMKILNFKGQTGFLPAGNKIIN